MNRRQILACLPALAAAPAALANTRSQDMFGPKARLKPAICAYSYRKELADKTLTYTDLVKIAVENGIDGLDLTVYWFPNTSESFLMPLRRMAYINGVDIYSISVRTDFCNPDKSKRRDQVRELMDWIDVASHLGAGHIRVFGGHAPKGYSEADAIGWCVDSLIRASDYAGKRGVILGLENHGGITERASKIIDVVQKVDSDYVGINLDTGNFIENAIPQIEMCLPYAVASQYKTMIAGAKPKEEVKADWDQLTAMFAKSGYKGYLALEYEAPEPAATAMPRLLAELRGLCQKYTSR
ncbi:MAG: sugar phosphate isomerase/epimerase [Bryobacterales bacterium]|nr:sugar phosphate isomerase/epimerase [Bryobacterales bacterium]